MNKAIANIQKREQQNLNNCFIIFMNSGDTFKHKHVLYDIFYKEKYDNIDVVYGNIIYQYSYGKFLYKPESIDMMLYKMPIFHQASFLRGSIFQDYLFDTRYKIVADYAFFKMLYIEKYYYYYIDYTIGVFEAETGITSTQKLKRMRELALLNNDFNTLKYKLNVLNYYVVKILKIFIPTKWIYRRRKNLKNILVFIKNIEEETI